MNQSIKKITMTKTQISVLFTGCLGVLFYALSLYFQINQLGYIALFLGRISGALYCVCVDRLRFYYFLPIGISFTNSFYASEQLLFVENLTQGIIYQVSAYNTFQKLNKK